MLVGITLPDGGAIRYFGLDLHKHREACLQRINFSSSYNMLQNRITVWENFIVFARLYRVDRPETRIRSMGEYFGITRLMDQRFMTLSAGQKTRVNLVKALLNDPEVILMDEPTASLDPDIADRTLSLIEHLREARDLSIVYTSHQMDEVTRICDEVIFLDHGRIVAQDSPRGLDAPHRWRDRVHVRVEGEPQAVITALRPRFEDVALADGTSSSSPRRNTRSGARSSTSARPASKCSRSTSASQPSRTCFCRSPAVREAVAGRERMS